MTRMTKIWWSILALALALAFQPAAPSFGEEEKGKVDPAAVSPGEQPKAPLYTPPRRGAPAIREGGGTRGAGGGLPAVFALIPAEHTGLTIAEQPVLHWYLSAPTDRRIDLTVNRTDKDEPLLETTLEGPFQAGIHAIRLAERGIQLEPGKTYTWYVAIVADPERRAGDIYSGGAIERVAPPPPIEAARSTSSLEERARIYAQNGIWYDALAALSEAISARPSDPSLREERAALLEQVGLPEVAAAERAAPAASAP